MDTDWNFISDSLDSLIKVVKPDYDDSSLKLLHLLEVVKDYVDDVCIFKNA